jgi:muconate cycloisomerase
LIIRDIEYIPIKVPRAGKWRSALGAHSYGDAAIVILYSDNDAYGIGEVSSIWDSFASGLVNGMGQKLKDAIIGMDVYNIIEMHKKMDAAIAWSLSGNCIKAGIEMAAYDLIGKIKDMPVYNILGGKNREKIQVSRSIGMGTIEERFEQVSYFVEKGYKTVKLKAGLDMGNDLKVIEAVRKEYGSDISIRVDANMSWKEPKSVLKLIDKLYGLGVISIEQPLSPDNIEGLAFLREHSKLPIMVDESLWNPIDAFKIIKAQAADIMNVYVSESGGLYNAMMIANMCDISGVGVCIGSMPELGVGTAAALHLGIAAPQINHPSDVIGNTYFQDDIIEEILPFKDGYAYSIDRPGLGVTLNWNKINKYRSDKEKEGK